MWAMEIPQEGIDARPNLALYSYSHTHTYTGCHCHHNPTPPGANAFHTTWILEQGDRGTIGLPRKQGNVCKNCRFTKSSMHLWDSKGG